MLAKFAWSAFTLKRSAFRANRIELKEKRSVNPNKNEF